MNQAEFLLEARSVRKNYGAVEALKSVDFMVRRGELVSLVGDNGAGKSTLIKIISGIVEPSAGEFRFEGRDVRVDSPMAARQLGIETVYQDLGLCDNLSVTENVYLGRELTRGWGPLRFLDRRRMAATALEILSGIGVNVPDMHATTGSLSGGQRQSVALARCRLWEQKLVILDEPTAALGVEESARVVKIIRSMREAGVAMILVSHNIRLVMELSHRVVVLRAGRKVGDAPVQDLSEHRIVEMITGARELIA